MRYNSQRAATSIASPPESVADGTAGSKGASGMRSSFPEAGSGTACPVTLAFSVNCKPDGVSVHAYTQQLTNDAKFFNLIDLPYNLVNIDWIAV